VQWIRHLLTAEITAEQKMKVLPYVGVVANAGGADLTVVATLTPVAAVASTSRRTHASKLQHKIVAQPPFAADKNKTSFFYPSSSVSSP
jgi:hypothetical protein